MTWYPIPARPLGLASILSMLVVLCVATLGAAQQFRSDTPDDKAKRLGASGQIWVRDPGAYASGKAQFDEYFQKYFFPAMTRSTPGGLAEVGKLRIDLFKKYLWGTTNAQLQKDLTDMAFKAMVKIVGSAQAPPYHPAVRYNAILVIGLLDDQYAIDAGSSARPPRPHAGANKALTQIVGGATTSDRFPPPVVLGAVIGLERHAKYHQALAPEAVKAMTAALLKLVSHDKPIQNMNPEANAWLRLRAANALAQLRTPGENNAIHNAFVKLAGSFKSLDDRCEAAALLGDLDYKEAKIDGPAATTALFKLAGEVSADELKRAIDFEKIQISGGGSVPGRRIQFDSTDPSATQDGFPRRHVLARLVNLRRGLRAIKAAVPAESQKEIDTIIAVIQPVIDAASNDSLGALAVAETIRTMNDQLIELVGAPEGDTDDEFSAGGDATAAAAAPAADAPPAVADAAAAPGAGTPPTGAPAAGTPPAAITPAAQAPATAPAAAAGAPAEGTE